MGRAARLWFGSTTTRLLRESTLPVLAVPPKAPDPFLMAGPAPVARIVVGTDFSAASGEALRQALALGALFDAPVTCLHVVPTVSTHARWNAMVASAADDAMRAARARMEEMVHAHQTADARLTGEVRSGDAAGVLIETAAGHGAIIVVSLGGADPSQRPGTTAYRVLSGTEAPVLAVPAGLQEAGLAGPAIRRV